MYVNTIKRCHVRVLENCHQIGCETERGEESGGKIEWKLSEVSYRAVSRG